jgi:4-hydroxyphenylpyruvate dioxygenase
MSVNLPLTAKRSATPPTRWGWRASSSSNTPPRAAGAGPGAGDQMGFKPVARHRSREVLLYRQGGMNVVVNAHGVPPGTDEAPQITAVALRVRDAGAAWRRGRPGRLAGAGARCSRWSCTSPACTAPARAASTSWTAGASSPSTTSTSCPSPRSTRRCRPWPACTGSASCSTWARTASPTGPSSTPRCSASRPAQTSSASASCRAGSVLASPCGSFFLQLIEPDSRWWTIPASAAARGLRHARRAGGRGGAAPRGVDFVETDRAAHRGARRGHPARFGGVMFELVHHAEEGLRPCRCALPHRRLRHGHHHAGRPAGGQAARHPRGRLRPGDAGRARPGGPRRRLAARRCRRCRPAACASPASRCCATSKACRATCTTTRSTSRARCSRCAPRWAARCCWPARQHQPACHAPTDDAIARDLRKLAMMACRTASRWPTRA